MIYHYINLASWRELIDIHEKNIDFYYCDTVSLYFMAKIFGFTPELVPGPTVVELAVKNKSREKTLFLVCDDDTAACFRKSHKLMRFDQDIYVYPELEMLIDEGDFDEVFVGISSPKQNLLAKKLHNFIPKATIYCIGAALNPKSISEVNSKYSRTGFQWFEFLIRSPHRTVVKIWLTLRSMVAIIFDSKVRCDFKIFCSKLVSRNCL